MLPKRKEDCFFASVSLQEQRNADQRSKNRLFKINPQSGKFKIWVQHDAAKEMLTSEKKKIVNEKSRS